MNMGVAFTIPVLFTRGWWNLGSLCALASAHTNSTKKENGGKEPQKCACYVNPASSTFLVVQQATITQFD